MRATLLSASAMRGSSLACSAAISAMMASSSTVVSRPSLYGALRKEPRGDSVSTIEAAAYCLAALADDAALAERALAPLRLLLARNDGGAPARRPDRRRHVHR